MKMEASAQSLVAIAGASQRQPTWQELAGIYVSRSRELLGFCGLQEFFNREYRKFRKRLKKRIANPSNAFWRGNLVMGFGDRSRAL
jgi:hypothetical protein